jgi:hypothetical protein
MKVRARGCSGRRSSRNWSGKKSDTSHAGLSQLKKQNLLSLFVLGKSCFRDTIKITLREMPALATRLAILKMGFFLIAKKV